MPYNNMMNYEHSSGMNLEDTGNGLRAVQEQLPIDLAQEGIQGVRQSMEHLAAVADNCGSISLAGTHERLEAALSKLETAAAALQQAKSDIAGYADRIGLDSPGAGSDNKTLACFAKLSPQSRADDPAASRNSTKSRIF